jgi:hypothetical protein
MFNGANLYNQILKDVAFWQNATSFVCMREFFSFYSRTLQRFIKKIEFESRMKIYVYAHCRL